MHTQHLNAETEKSEEETKRLYSEARRRLQARRDAEDEAAESKEEKAKEEAKEKSKEQIEAEDYAEWTRHRRAAVYNLARGIQSLVISAGSPRGDMYYYKPPAEGEGCDEDEDENRHSTIMQLTNAMGTVAHVLTDIWALPSNHMMEWLADNARRLAKLACFEEELEEHEDDEHNQREQLERDVQLELEIMEAEEAASRRH